MRFYSTIEAMRFNSPPYGDPFILQWEIPNPKDGQERKYVVFDGIEEYLRYFRQGRYTTCHEVIINSNYDPKAEVAGHPAFDLDIKLEAGISIPDTWQQDFQCDLLSVLQIQYPEADFNIQVPDSEWVWISSDNPTKISKHLVLRSVVFSMWKTQMKILIDTLSNMPSKKSSPHIISCVDAAITRNLGSLRLPLNSKKPVEIDGHTYSYPLHFDNPQHTFLDGIILLHDDTGYISRSSVYLTPSELHEEYTRKYAIHVEKRIAPTEQLDEESEDELVQCFYRLNKRIDTGLQVSGVSGGFLQLRRSHPGLCPISRRVHESDGSYMFKKGYNIMYGCHRGCTTKIGNMEYKYLNVTPLPGNKAKEVALQIHQELPED